MRRSGDSGVGPATRRFARPGAAARLAETQLADSQARTAAAETKSERAIAELFAVTQRLAIAETQLVTERERAEQATAEFTALVHTTRRSNASSRIARSDRSRSPQLRIVFDVTCCHDHHTEGDSGKCRRTMTSVQIFPTFAIPARSSRMPT
jgi:hypothetical protein